jgi:hypothetical protein
VVRRYLTTVTPSWSVSVAVWVTVLAIDVFVPVTARDIEIVRCQDGYTNLNPIRTGLVVMLVVPTLLALWVCVLHFADEPTRRPLVAVVTAALVAAAAASVVVVFAVLDIGSEVTGGSGC